VTKMLYNYLIIYIYHIILITLFNLCEMMKMLYNLRRRSINQSVDLKNK